MNEARDNIEIRLHEDGTLDELLIYDPHDGRCLYHMEQMADDWFWMRVNGVTQDLVVHIGAIIGLCDGKPLLDDNGKVKGFEKINNPKVDTNYYWDDPSTEFDCHPETRTPEKERLAEIGQIINKYGVASVLKDIAAIYRQGRKAYHDNVLVEGLESIYGRFQEDEKVYWQARIANDTTE